MENFDVDHHFDLSSVESGSIPVPAAQPAPSAYASCLVQQKGASSVSSSASSIPTVSAPVLPNRPLNAPVLAPPAPAVLPPASPQQTALVVNLPSGVMPGHFLRAMGPDGVVFTFQAPIGSTPGCPVKVVLPNQTAVLSVRIPEGAQPGSEISALSPNGVVLRLSAIHHSAILYCRPSILATLIIACLIILNIPGVKSRPVRSPARSSSFTSRRRCSRTAPS